MMANNDKKRFPANQPIVQRTITAPELPIVMFATNCYRRSCLCIGNRSPINMDISLLLCSFIKTICNLCIFVFA